MSINTEYIRLQYRQVSKEEFEDVLKNTDYIRDAFNVICYRYKHNEKLIGYDMKDGIYYLAQ